MTQPLIVYSSVYGSTKMYAHACASTLGTECASVDQVPLADLAAGAGTKASKADASSSPSSSAFSSIRGDGTAPGPCILFTPNYGGRCEGVDFIRQAAQAGRPSACVLVGMTRPDIARRSDILRGILKDDSIARFYLPGKLFYSSISATHRAALWTITKILKAKPSRSIQEQALIDGYAHDIDTTDLAQLDPIIEWVRGHGYDVAQS